MVRNLTVAAAVAAALASSAAMAGQPTPAQAASPTVGLYIAGASAPRPAVLNTLENSARTDCRSAVVPFNSRRPSDNG